MKNVTDVNISTYTNIDHDHLFIRAVHSNALKNGYFGNYTAAQKMLNSKNITRLYKAGGKFQLKMVSK